MSDVFLAGLMFTVACTIFISVLLAFRRQQAERMARRESFVEAILRCLERDTLSSINDLHDLFRAHFTKSNLNYGDFEGLSQLVRSAIKKVATGENMSRQKNLSKGLPQLRTLLAANEDCLRQEQVRIPFSGTPSPERQLLEDILELTTSDKELIRFKLNELAKAIRVRQETIDRLGTESHQSLVWAKWGLAGTVVFSLISIALAVWALK